MFRQCLKCFDFLKWKLGVNETLTWWFNINSVSTFKILFTVVAFHVYAKNIICLFIIFTSTIMFCLLIKISPMGLIREFKIPVSYRIISIVFKIRMSVQFPAIQKKINHMFLTDFTSCRSQWFFCRSCQRVRHRLRDRGLLQPGKVLPARLILIDSACLLNIRLYWGSENVDFLATRAEITNQPKSKQITFHNFIVFEY